MRKLSILALVVILAGALSVAGFADPSTEDVTFNTATTLSVNITSTGGVNFTGNLNPSDTYYKFEATTLEVQSNTTWTLSYNKISGPTSVLGVKFGDNLNENNWDNQGSQSIDGEDDQSPINVNYKLDNLENLSSGEHTVTVEFTVNTR